MQGVLHRRLNSKGTPKQKKKPAPYTDTDTLLGFIENRQQVEFRAAQKFINNEDRLKLAEAIIAQYLPGEPDEGPSDKEDDEDSQETVLPTPPPSPSHQTREQWLDLLLETLLSDPRASRILADELIQKMGQDEMRQGPLEKQSRGQKVSHFCILFTYVIENTDGLCYNKDNMKQTLFHIAAINGALTAIKICLCFINSCCSGHLAHAQGCSIVTSLLTSVDKEGYSPLSYATTKSKTPAVSGILDFLGNTGPEEIRKLLRKAITSSSGNNIDIMRELLTVRPAGTEKEYRTDVLDQDILQLAAKNFNFKVFDFLVTVGSTVLSSRDCRLIHYVVHIGQVEAAKYLLKNFAHLATKLHVHPDHACGPGSNTTIGEQNPLILTQGPASSAEVDEEKFSVLALYNGEDTELRDLIFETLVERLPISELREHLGGQTCKSSYQLCMSQCHTTTNRPRNRDGQRDLTRCHHPGL